MKRFHAPAALCAVLATLAASGATAAERFVSLAGTDTSNDCSVSTNPCATIPAAILAAGSGDAILIAAGSYKVSLDFTAANAVLLTLQGGWDDTFTAQNATLYPTTLTRNKDRVLTVLSSGAGDPKTLTITDLTFHASKPKSRDFDGEIAGGAILAQAIGTGEVVLTLDRVIFSENKSKNDGGAMRIATTGGGTLNLAMSQCEVTFSKASGEGGVIEADSYEFSQIHVSVADSSFGMNNAKDSGGVFDLEAWEFSTLTLAVSRSKFLGNTAKTDGGAIRLAAYDLAHLTASALGHSAFVANRSKDDGGALAVEANDSSTITVGVASSTFSGNDAKDEGGGMMFEINSPTAALTASLLNDIVWANTGGDGLALSVAGANGLVTLDYCNVDDVLGSVSYGTANLVVDPMLQSDGFHLLAGSPMIDAGTCNGNAAGSDVDIEARPGPNGPNPAKCDIGADEY